MKTQHSATLQMFISTDATRCTYVLPMPSKNALIDHRRRHRDDGEEAPARIRDCHLLHLGHIDHRPHHPRQEREPQDREERTCGDAEEDGVAEHRTRGLPVALGVAPRRRAPAYRR